MGKQCLHCKERDGGFYFKKGLLIQANYPTVKIHLFWQWRQVLGAALGNCTSYANQNCCLCLLTVQANPFSRTASTYSRQKFLCMVGIWAKGKSWVIFQVNSAAERSLETASVLLTKARTGSPEDMWSTSLLVGLHVGVKLLEMVQDGNAVQ